GSLSRRWGPAASTLSEIPCLLLTARERQRSQTQCFQRPRAALLLCVAPAARAAKEKVEPELPVHGQNHLCKSLAIVRRGQGGTRGLWKAFEAPFSAIHRQGKDLFKQATFVEERTSPPTHSAFL